MRVLVTGGAGFIGSHVADALLAAGHDVFIVDDLSSGTRANLPDRARFLEGDIRDDAFVARVFDETKPEIVSHQAAQTSVAISTREPVRDAAINVMGSLNLLVHSVRCGVGRFVFASTGGAVYGEVPEGKRARPDWVPLPISPYACSKFATEGYLRAYRHEHGLPYTILRYANVYGPRQDPHGEAGVVAIFSSLLLEGKPLTVNARARVGDDGCVRDYVFVGDVVRANMRAVAGEIASPIVNVCTGIGISTKELAQKLMAAVGIQQELRFAPRRAGDIERSVLERESEAVPEAAVALDEGLAKTVEWMRGG